MDELVSPVVTAVVRYLSGKSEVFFGSIDNVRAALIRYAVDEEDLVSKWQEIITGTPTLLYGDREITMFLNTVRVQGGAVLQN